MRVYLAECLYQNDWNYKSWSLVITNYFQNLGLYHVRILLGPL